MTERESKIFNHHRNALDNFKIKLSKLKLTSKTRIYCIILVLKRCRRIYIHKILWLFALLTSKKKLLHGTRSQKDRRISIIFRYSVSDFHLSDRFIYIKNSKYDSDLNEVNILLKKKITIIPFYTHLLNYLRQP